MPRDSITDVLAFLAVARERSFTRAAARLGVSQSALSHTVRGLEERMSVRLLTRTTRSVSPTEAGERLLRTVGPCFEQIDAELDAVRGMAETPKGTVRITAIDYAADTVLWPRLRPLLAEYPELRIEIASDYSLVDIVAERFDFGVRHGDQVARDMVAVRIAPDQQMAIVGSPGYFEAHPPPRRIEDLMRHNCVSLRLTSGGLYAWELKDGDGSGVQVRVEGQAVFNGVYQMLHAALTGCGLAFLPDDLVAPYVKAGQLRRVLKAHCPAFPGLHAYYPSARHKSRALQVVIDALRWRT